MTYDNATVFRPHDALNIEGASPEEAIVAYLEIWRVSDMAALVRRHEVTLIGYAMTPQLDEAWVGHIAKRLTERFVRERDNWKLHGAMPLTEAEAARVRKCIRRGVRKAAFWTQVFNLAPVGERLYTKAEVEVIARQWRPEWFGGET